ncbi:DNA polymerase IV [Metabacillus sp. GX 13764]|uniref:DNA polymerase IV n=1 Tax=Metabacillus kandeliae TaxID=2900151 RepID=UPI001E324B12|nr:DNA polymerase IV [Metabacillus kandeliae]MCD7033247.1 DNA polymerase IV [Metabacillus kandeliae]
MKACKGVTMMNGIQNSKGRILFHIDMNSFYASVEMAFDPELKGKPIAIAGNPEERKGIIVTCSYEARAYGVKTTMPLWQAKKLCPSLIIKRPNFDRYRQASRAMFDILREITPIVEPVSIDEGYMDLTDAANGKNPVEIARKLQERLMGELLLPSSIGIAPNKFLAKMASNMKKPLGITVLRKRELKEKLWPLPIEEMHGVGNKTAEKLKGIGITTIDDLAHFDTAALKSLLGINGERLNKRANGIDDRPVDPESINEFKSVGHSATLPRNTDNPAELDQVLKSLAESVANRMKRKEVLASKLTVMIRYSNMATFTRGRKLANPAGDAGDIFEQARRIFYQNWTEEPIRLLGITGSDLLERKEAFKQLDLFSFEEDAKKEPLYSVIDQINAKYGDQAIRHGTAGKRESDSAKGTSFNKDFLRE